MTFETFFLRQLGWTPNNTLPAIIYRGALDDARAGDAAEQFETLFGRHGWPARWRNGILDDHHYHSTAHEALGFAKGSARLMLGGPKGVEVRVEAGDAALLPVGTGHCRLHASDDFLVVGAYPPGQDFDICRTEASPQMRARMSQVVYPFRDPVGGAEGPMTRLWRKNAEPKEETWTRARIGVCGG